MLVQKQSVVYIIRNLINGKFYVGSTKDFQYRKSQHLRDLRKNQHHSPILQRTFKKYGEDALSFEVLEVVPDFNNLYQREQYYLDILKPEYNICHEAKKPPSRLKVTQELESGGSITVPSSGIVNKYGAVSLNYKLKHAKTPEQKLAVIKSEIAGMDIKDIWRSKTDKIQCNPSRSLAHRIELRALFGLLEFVDKRLNLLLLIEK